MLDNTRDHDRVLIRGETLEIFHFSQFPLLFYRSLLSINIFS